jgi:hypothetical protein
MVVQLKIESELENFSEIKAGLGHKHDTSLIVNLYGARFLTRGVE